MKAQSSVSVNVTGNTHEYEIKIRTLNSKIQELESQLRAQKMDFEGKVRAKDNRIRELEENVKIGNSQVTEMGGTHYGGGSSYSGNERMSSSVYSQSSGTDSQTPSKTPSSQTALSGAKQYGGGGNYTGYKGDNSSSGYSNTGGRITGATESSSTISYGRGEGT